MTFKPFHLPFMTALCVVLPGAGFAATTHTVETGELEPLKTAFVEASAESFAPDADVTADFVKYSDYGRANDVMLLQLYMAAYLPDGEVERLISAFDWDSGCWKDIDYESNGRGRWPATLHVTRLYALTKIYVSKDQKWYSSDDLSRLIHSALDYWFTTMPVCPNWWHNDIGVPKKMTAVLLMLGDEVTGYEIEGGLAVLERSAFGRTGQNKVWLAGNNLMKGLLIGDEALVVKARDYIAEEIRVTSQEGIQEDWSFHQHGPQNQFGNYGLAYADGIAFWMRVFAGTDYMFTDEEIEIFSNFMKEGLCRSVYKGVFDLNFCGRQNFINAGRGKACAMAIAAKNLSVALERQARADEALSDGSEPGLAQRLESYKAGAELYDAVARENLKPEKYANSLVGAKYFPNSDCGIYRQKDWYASIRMHSMRTIGFEFTNMENTLANFSADGALVLMQDGKEFVDIFAYWDWRKVPGVTAYDDGKRIKCDDSMSGKLNRSEHVAGAVLGDVMATSMELDRDGLHAFKTNFFFPDCIISLGADIRSVNSSFREVTTAVDQTHLLGGVVCDKHSSASGRDMRTKVSWVHHNDRGYITLDGSKMLVSTAVQRGRWDDIEPSFKDKWDEGAVFKCWFDHPLKAITGSNADSYAYVTLPCVSSSAMASIAKKVSKGGKRNPYRVLLNTADCQAVYYGDILCAVVHKAGNYFFDSGLSVRADKPCIIIRNGTQEVREDFPETIESVAERVFKRAAVQFALLDKNLSSIAVSKSDPAMFPRTFEGGELKTSNLMWWCSGFYPGSLWYLYEYTGDSAWRDLALKYTMPLEPLRSRTNDHDVGFQVMSSFGNALRLTGNRDYEAIIKESAASLATRFNPAVGCTRSWDGNKWSFPVIIDNMMNLELLFAGEILSGDGTLGKVAVTHAETTMKNHFRPDYSTFHLVDYDPKDGHVIGRQTVQGLADGSAWSRGQAWALYGYTMVFRYTKDGKFLRQAQNIADYLLSRLPEDGIPYWDYDSKEIPDDLRDASAAAIMASALVELSGFTSYSASAYSYLGTALKIMRTLATDEYLAAGGEAGGFLLKHSVGNKPGNSEVDVPLTYADYYFLEALLRYMDTKKK